MDLFPLVAGTLQSRDTCAHFVVENFRSAARDGLQSRLHQTLNRFSYANLGNFRDAQNFRRGKAVPMHLRVARLQRAQEIFVVADLQIGMQAALQQNSGAAKLQHLVDFFVDVLERQNVAVFRPERAIERAERTILGAEIRIVDVAVDLVSRDTRVVLLQAHLVRFHADADEVVGFQHFERLAFRQSQDLSLSSRQQFVAVRPNL